MTHPSLHWGEVSPESESTPAAVRNQNSEVRDQLVLWSGLMTCQLINHEHMSIGCLSHHHQSLSELWLCHNQDSAQNFALKLSSQKHSRSAGYFSVATFLDRHQGWPTLAFTGERSHQKSESTPAAVRCYEENVCSTFHGPQTGPRSRQEFLQLRHVRPLVISKLQMTHSSGRILQVNPRSGTGTPARALKALRRQEVQSCTTSTKTIHWKMPWNSQVIQKPKEQPAQFLRLIIAEEVMVMFACQRLFEPHICNSAFTNHHFFCVQFSQKERPNHRPMWSAFFSIHQGVRKCQNREGRKQQHQRTPAAHRLRWWPTSSGDWLAELEWEAQLSARIEASASCVSTSQPLLGENVVMLPSHQKLLLQRYVPTIVQ